MNILYIAGAGRSGSTLLEMILGSIPGVFAMGEVSGFWGDVEDEHFLCSCGRPLRQCDVWGKVIDRLGERAGDQLREAARLARKYDRTRNLLWFPLLAAFSPGEVRQLTRDMQLLYEAVKGVTGAPLLVDSSKTPLHLRLLSRTGSADLRVLQLLRDARAVAYSWNRRPKRQRSTNEADRYMDRRGLVSSVIRWVLENAFSEREAARLMHHELLRYEDFVGQPYEELARALDGLGLGGLDLRLLRSPVLRLLPTHSLGGNPLRFDGGETRIVPDREWQTRMPRWQRVALGLLAAPWLRHYGYSI